MPHVRTVNQTVYKFEELDERAKERARDKVRGLEYEDSDWAEFIIEDAQIIAEIIGIELSTRTVKLMGGSNRQDPEIYWEGFNTQGSGACFKGRYRYANGSSRKIREHAPNDEKLHAIVDGLVRIQRRVFYKAVVDIGTSGGSSHAWSMQFMDLSEPELSPFHYDAVCELLRDFAKWIYKQLEQEYEYRMSNTAIEETIQANDWEFDEQGRMV